MCLYKIPLFQSSILKKYSAVRFFASPKEENKEYKIVFIKLILGGYINQRCITN